MSALHTIPQGKARDLVFLLTALGDELEAAQNPVWFSLAQAAATLEGLRLGLIEIEPAGGHHA